MAKKIFVSLPMRGKAREEILTAQGKIIDKAFNYFNESVILIESFLSENAKLNPLECLGESIKRMSRADYVIFGEGYENARGCRIEYDCAREYGKKILIEHGNDFQEVF